MLRGRATDPQLLDLTLTRDVASLLGPPPDFWAED